jgi:hypothetical protein
MVFVTVWLSALSFVVLKMRKDLKTHEQNMFEIVSRIRGLRLAVKVLGIRQYVEPD